MGHLRVLLVEDEKLIRLILAEALADAGMHVVAAASGDDAVAIIDGPEGIDLLLTDMQMPGRLGGAAVAQHARRRYPDIAVIFMTGRPEVLQEVGTLGPRDSFLRKPFGPSALMPIIGRLVGGMG